MPTSPLPFSGAHWVDHVARHAFSIPDDVAIRFEDSSITWAGLNDRVLRLAAAFAAHGVGEGDRVAILTTNRPEFVETVIAANALRAIAVPLNFRLAPAEVAYVLGDSGATVIVTDARARTAGPGGDRRPGRPAGGDRRRPGLRGADRGRTSRRRRRRRSRSATWR